MQLPIVLLILTAFAGSSKADWVVNVFEGHEGCTGDPVANANAGFAENECESGQDQSAINGNFTNVDFSYVDIGSPVGDGIYNLNLYATFDNTTLQCYDLIGSFSTASCYTSPLNGMLIQGYSVTCVHGFNPDTLFCNTS